jgi:hypothetical protein
MALASLTLEPLVQTLAHLLGVPGQHAAQAGCPGLVLFSQLETLEQGADAVHVAPVSGKDHRGFRLPFADPVADRFVEQPCQLEVAHRKGRHDPPSILDVFAPCRFLELHVQPVQAAEDRHAVSGLGGIVQEDPAAERRDRGKAARELPEADRRVDLFGGPGGMEACQIGRLVGDVLIGRGEEGGVRIQELLECFVVPHFDQAFLEAPAIEAVARRLLASLGLIASRELRQDWVGRRLLGLGTRGFRRLRTPSVLSGRGGTRHRDHRLDHRDREQRGHRRRRRARGPVAKVLPKCMQRFPRHVAPRIHRGQGIDLGDHGID